MRILLQQLPDRLRTLLIQGAGSRIVSGFMMVAALTVGSKAVSFFKDAAVARQFGTGDAIDAFMVSFGLLTFLATLFGGGLPEAFLPNYTELAHLKNRRRAQRLAVQGFLLHGLSLAVVAAGCAWVAPEFIAALTHGFDADKKELAVRILRHLLPFMALYAMSYHFSTWLRADKRFGLAASAPMLVPLCIIGMLLAKGADATVETLVTGTVAGAALHLLALALGVAWRLPWEKRFWQGCFRLWEPRLRSMTEQAGHYIFAGSIFSSSVVVDQTMAAWLPPGNVAVLGYTEKICGIVLAVTVAPSCDVLFPYFADKVARRDWPGVRRQLWGSAGAILSAGLPAALLLSLLAPWVVALLFERGSFSADDTARVAAVLRFAALQIPFYIVGSLASRVIVAMQATKFIIWLSFFGLVCNATLNWLLMGPMGISGIALSTVAVQMGSAGIACFYVLGEIRRRMGQNG